MTESDLQFHDDMIRMKMQEEFDQSKLSINKDYQQKLKETEDKAFERAYKKAKQELEQQNNNLSEVANTLDTISNTLDSIDFSNTDSVSLSEVTESINNIDTTIFEAQTQDILSIVNSQQEQIDTIQSDIQEIKQLLNQLLKQ